MARNLSIQVKVTEQERAQFESVARMQGKGLAEHIRDTLDEQFEQIDWYEEGLAQGQRDQYTPPIHTRPGDKDWQDYAQGWAEGQKEMHGE